MDEANQPKPDEPKSDAQFMDVRLPSQPSSEATATAEASPAPAESPATPVTVTTAPPEATTPAAEPAPEPSPTPAANDAPTDKPQAEKPKEIGPQDPKQLAKPKHGHMLVITIAVVVMLAIGGVVVYMFMTKNDGSVKAPSTNSDQVATAVSTADVDSTSSAVDNGANQADSDLPDGNAISDAALGL